MRIQIFIIIALTLKAIYSFGQFSRQNIDTDSSSIEIIKNSVYHIYEETLNNKDSVWYSVHFIKDTTRLKREGWITKNGKHLGVWKEYNFEGELIYTMDYDNAVCIKNKEFFPYSNLLEKMKLKADSLIISAYSQEFFDNNVRFEFDCYAYHGYWVEDIDNTKFWSCTSLGTWIEPLKSKPNTFLFRYSVRIGDTDWYPEMIGMKLDSSGNYMPSKDYYNNYGFENVKSSEKTFKLNKLKAMEIAKQHELKTEDPDKISEFLKWEKFHRAEFYDGQFRYYITEWIDEIKEINEGGRSSVTYKYNVYSFNPWTGEFVEMKRMKNIYSWEALSGSWTGLIPDNE